MFGTVLADEEFAYESGAETEILDRPEGQDLEIEEFRRAEPW